MGLSYAVCGKLRLRQLLPPLCWVIPGERYYEKFVKIENCSPLFWRSEGAKVREKFIYRSKIQHDDNPNLATTRFISCSRFVETDACRAIMYNIFVGTGTDILGISPTNMAHIDSNY